MFSASFLAGISMENEGSLSERFAGVNSSVSSHPFLKYWKRKK
jgi:hypothetical protein